MKLNLRTRLLLSLGLILLLVAAANIYGLNQLNVLADLTNQIYNHPLQVTRAVLSADAGIVKMHRSLKDVALANNAEDMETARNAINEYEKEVYAQLNLVEERILGDEEAALIAETSQLFKDWKPIRDEVINLMIMGETEKAAAITKEKGAQHVVLLNSKIEALRDYAEAKAAGMYDNAQATRLKVLTTTIIALVVALLAGGLFGWFLTGSIAQSLAKVTRMAERMATTDLKELTNELQALAAGDLTRSYRVKAEPLHLNRKDEIGQMALAFNTMIGQLQETSDAFAQMIVNLSQLVGQVVNNANAVGAASAQMAIAAGQAGQATQQIATSSQEQVRGISQSVDLTNQISAAIQQVAGIAQTGAKDTAEAARSANNGAITIKATIEGMGRIKAKVGLSVQKVREMGQRSEQIGAIVETIDDIASQTNLLALNAAIEAARAGEHGKGFAVVADEVRKLAEKSSSATQEIAGLIRDIQQTVAQAVAAMEEGAAEVEAGVAQANESGQVLAGILQAAEGTREQVEMIAAASHEMDNSANELVGAMDGVSAVVEENTAATEEMAAQVEEVTASAQSLSAMAQELQTLVAQFKLAASKPQATPSLVPELRLSADVELAAGDGYDNEELPLMDGIWISSNGH